MWKPSWELGGDAITCMDIPPFIKSIQRFMKKQMHFIVFLLIVLIGDFSCKKKDFVELYPQNTTEIGESKTRQKFFSTIDSVSKGLALVMEKIKNQDSEHYFIEELVKRNGYPLWNQAISNESNFDNKAKNDELNSATINPLEGDTLLYLIPFKKDTVTRINTFLACIKVDNKYIFKLHKRNMYDNASPDRLDSKNFGRGIMAIFGVFEKKINFVNSINIGGNYNETITNYIFKFKRKDGSIIDFNQSTTRDSYEIRSVTYCVSVKPCNYCAYASPTILGSNNITTDVVAQQCYTEYYISYTNQVVLLVLGPLVLERGVRQALGVEVPLEE